MRRGGGGLDVSAAGGGGYFELARSPLHCLVFVLPFVVAFEVGFMVEGGVQDIRARHLMGLVFDTFGAGALYAAPVLILLVLLVMQMLRGGSWRVRGRVVSGMWLESAALALPLFVLGQVAALLGAGSGIAAATAGAGGEAVAVGWWERLAMDVARASGAGLYEEFVFRLVGIALLHFVVTDLLGASKLVGAVVSVLATSVLFAVYHDLGAAGGGVDVGRAAFLFVAGVYFGVLYLSRGFGIAVGVHALYDVLAFQTSGA